MIQRGQLIGDAFALTGVVLAAAATVLLAVQYLLWHTTNIWHPINIRVIFDVTSISAHPAFDAVLKSPLSVAMFAVGLVFIWIVAENYEHHARSLR
jgi:hypothetical protein